MNNQPIRDEFLEKRRARQKKARKKRLIAGFVVFMIAIIITTVILCLTVLFPIKNIVASGSQIYSSEEIIENSGIKTGDNIFTFSKRNAINSLKNKLPFVDKVEFKRSLPDKLTIKVYDAKPYYCIEQKGEYYNVSKSGWVLEKLSEKPSGNFEIKIKNVSCSVGNQIVFKDEKSHKMLENTIKLLEDNSFRIDYVDVTNSVTIKAGVEGRFDVNFGTENSLENKIMHLKATIKKIGDNKSGSINLSMWNNQKPQATFVENNIK